MASVWLDQMWSIRDAEFLVILVDFVVVGKSEKLNIKFLNSLTWLLWLKRLIFQWGYRLLPMASCVCVCVCVCVPTVSQAAGRIVPIPPIFSRGQSVLSARILSQHMHEGAKDRAMQWLAEAYWTKCQETWKYRSFLARFLLCGVSWLCACAVGGNTSLSYSITRF